MIDCVMALDLLESYRRRSDLSRKVGALGMSACAAAWTSARTSVEYAEDWVERMTAHGMGSYLDRRELSCRCPSRPGEDCPLSAEACKRRRSS